MEKLQVRITVLSYKKSDLLMAISHDLSGFVVHGRSIEEIEGKLTGALKDFLEASGFNVFSIESHKEDIHDFGPPAFIASAALNKSYCAA